MNSELQNKLYEKYPALFVQRDWPMMQTCMCWGIEVGDGWYEILDKMCAALSKLEHPPQFSQIKEKFGTLRVYTDNCSDASDAIIAEAEAMSGVTCEICGQMGKINNGPWYTVRCEGCAKKGE